MKTNLMRDKGKMLNKVLRILIIISMVVTTSYADYEGGGGGESVGGKGVITAELISNVAKSETVEKNLAADIQTRYSYMSPELSIYELLVKSKKTEELVAVRIESLTNKSTLATSFAPINTYKNENVWLGSKEIYDVVLRFRMKNSWINDNKVNGQDIRLLKWSKNQSQWMPLDVKEIGKDGNYTYFESGITESSILAMGIGAGAVQESSTNIEQSNKTGQAQPTEIGIEITPEKPQAKNPGFEAIVMMLAIFMIYIIRKKKHEKR